MPLPTREQVFEALKPVQDPEIGLGVVDLGLIYDAEVEESGKVLVKMTLTTPACPYGDILIGQAHRAVSEMVGVNEVEIKLVWDPPWDPKEMCTDYAKDVLGIW
jgi:metal-sulfur cluster biosynthetic enzyme